MTNELASDATMNGREKKLQEKKIEENKKELQELELEDRELLLLE